MAIDREKLLNWPFKEVEHTYTFRDTILYALGLGVSIDQMDEDQLRFTYEENLQCLPSMSDGRGSEQGNRCDRHR
jgi:hypothetical protein